MINSFKLLLDMLSVMRFKGKHPNGSSVMRLLFTVSYLRFGGSSKRTDESSWFDEIFSFYKLLERQLVLRELKLFSERFKETKLEKFNS